MIPPFGVLPGRTIRSSLVEFAFVHHWTELAKVTVELFFEDVDVLPVVLHADYDPAARIRFSHSRVGKSAKRECPEEVGTRIRAS